MFTLLTLHLQLSACTCVTSLPGLDPVLMIGLKAPASQPASQPTNHPPTPPSLLDWNLTTIHGDRVACKLGFNLQLLRLRRWLRQEPR